MRVTDGAQHLGVVADQAFAEATFTVRLSDDRLVVIGLVVYPLTAVFAAVEGALFGLGPGVLVGVLGWVIVVATRCGRRGAA